MKFVSSIYFNVILETFNSSLNVSLISMFEAEIPKIVDAAASLITPSKPLSFNVIFEKYSDFNSKEISVGSVSSFVSVVSSICPLAFNFLIVVKILYTEPLNSDLVFSSNKINPLYSIFLL